MESILVWPDSQIIPGCPTEHIIALGNYAVIHQPEYIVNLGDMWDFPSLSSYDIGKKAHEGARYQEDIRAGYQALLDFESPLYHDDRYKQKHKKKLYKPTKYFLIGNHEFRLQKYINDYPILEGKLSFNDLGLEGLRWKRFDYLDIVDINGVKFSHKFLNPDSLSRQPFSSSIDTQLKTLGFSFVAGHLPGLQIANPRYGIDGRITRAVITGSFYLHDFNYQQPPQGNQYWRGAIHLKNVKDGNFILEELPIDFLMKNYL
jgi:hypothetical protein